MKIIKPIKNLIRLIPDDIFLKRAYKKHFGRTPDLKAPVTFCEKIQWLKIYDRKPHYSTMVDKYSAKEYVSSKIGNQYIIPTIGVWDKPEDIDFNRLPDRFVLKTTHNSGGILICKDKSTFNREIAIKYLNEQLSHEIYILTREWPYKNVKRRIIAEEYKTDSNGELNDYKFFCFNGKVRFLKVDFNRFSSHGANYYFPDWTLAPFSEHGVPSDPNKIIEKPTNLENMIILAEKLSEGHRFLRVDFFNPDNHIYFGELTFFPASGYSPFEPKEWEMKIGSWINL